MKRGSEVRSGESVPRELRSRAGLARNFLLLPGSFQTDGGSFSAAAVVALTH